MQLLIQQQQQEQLIKEIQDRADRQVIQNSFRDRKALLKIVSRLRTVLEGYEAWEAEVVCTGDCWRTSTGLILTQKLYEDLMVLQTQRNECLGFVPEGV